MISPSALRSFALALFVALVVGCAPKSAFLVQRPAELDVSGVERLVILDFDGPNDSGKIARAALVATFWDNHHYTLVDQAELARVRPIVTLTGAPDVGAAVDAARYAGVDAILTGQVVSYSADDDKQDNFNFNLAGAGAQNKRSGDAGGGLGVGFSKNEILTREASVGLAFKLIDIRTGQIRAARETSHNFNGRSVNGNVQLPGRERVLADLTHKCSRDVLAMLAPHADSVQVTLAKQYYGKGLSELHRGNDLAKNGNWSAAEAAWENALSQNRNNHAAHYNLALAAEARGDYPTAVRHVDLAIEKYGDVLYQKHRQQLDQRRAQYLAAVAQTQSKNTLAIARQPPSPGSQPASFEIIPPGQNLPPPR